MTERLMDLKLADRLHVDVTHAMAELKVWMDEHPRESQDYRVSDVERGLRLASVALDHLVRDEHYPELERAMAALRAAVPGAWGDRLGTE